MYISFAMILYSIIIMIYCNILCNKYVHSELRLFELADLRLPKVLFLQKSYYLLKRLFIQIGILPSDQLDGLKEQGTGIRLVGGYTSLH